MNSPCQMKPYDTNIDSFGGLSRRQQHFLSHRWNSMTFLSSLKWDTKK